MDFVVVVVVRFEEVEQVGLKMGLFWVMVMI